MILLRDFCEEAFLVQTEKGFETTILTSTDMIEEIKKINEDYRKNYGLDEDEEDFIKIIDDEKEHLEECMEDYYNNKELQKEFNYNEELFKKKCIEHYRELKQSLQDDIKKNRIENDI